MGTTIWIGSAMAVAGFFGAIGSRRDRSQRVAWSLILVGLLVALLPVFREGGASNGWSATATFVGGVAVLMTILGFIVFCIRNSQ